MNWDNDGDAPGSDWRRGLLIGLGLFALAVAYIAWEFLR